MCSFPPISWQTERPTNDTDGHESLHESYTFNGQMIIMKIIIDMIRTNDHNNNINRNIYNDHFYFNLY